MKTTLCIRKDNRGHRYGVEATESAITQVIELVEIGWGQAFVSRGLNRTIVGLVGDVELFDTLNLRAMDGVVQRGTHFHTVQTGQPGPPPGAVHVHVAGVPSARHGHADRGPVRGGDLRADAGIRADGEVGRCQACCAVALSSRVVRPIAFQGLVCRVGDPGRGPERDRPAGS